MTKGTSTNGVYDAKVVSMELLTALIEVDGGFCCSEADPVERIKKLVEAAEVIHKYITEN